MKYLIKFSYDGSKFYGFQRQKDRKSVQGTLEDAISIINKKETTIKGAGRTDVGVHAKYQCAHFDLDMDIPEKRLMNAINKIVRPYINVFECSKVKEDFHARFSVIKKEYIYKIWVGEFSTFKADYYLMYDRNIDTDKLEECAHLFKGVHNFHNFVSGIRDNYDAIIYDISIEKNNNEIIIKFTGKSFYRYMVRNLVGAMLDYNEDKCNIDLINKMLNDETCNHKLSTASAKGLYLNNICYKK